MKKIMVSVLLMAMTASMMSVNVFAHGGHGSGRRTHRQTQYEICSVEGCDQQGLHRHDGTYYTCQNHGSGCAGSRS